MRPVILVFAKAPVPGRVKTRLRPLVTLEEAAKLHKAFVSDTLESVHQLAGTVDVELWLDSPTDVWGPSYKLQRDGDLGARMLGALETAFASGRDHALIAGTDSPGLPLGHLRAILASPADVCAGPAADGGYYALAARRLHPEMFDGVAWSTDQTFAQTRAAAERAGLTFAPGPPWWDVDEPKDLWRLREIELPRYTREALASIPSLWPG